MAPKQGVIKVATCQFASGGNIKRNGAQIRRQIMQAKKRGADIVHFHECALSGYAGADMPSFRSYDWELLTEETESICRLARQKKVWVVLGSSHRLSGRHKPHNSLYVINPQGRIADRYDKRFCTGGDLENYSPGDHFVTFTVNGVKCGLLICYDIRFPELYRAYRKLDVRLMLHSFHNAGGKGPNIHTLIMRQSMQARGATNYMWVSGNNSSRHYQRWQSVFIHPNGVIKRALARNKAGVMINKVDIHEDHYDASGPWRARAMRGQLNSGTLVKDPRSRNRTKL